MPCITLLSDLGLQDSSVAVAKGILMQRSIDADIVDISHEVMPFHTAQAAYLLGCAYKNFPTGTCHLLLFDLFSDAHPKLILSEYNGHYFLSPDNGVIPLALGTNPNQAWQWYELKKEDTFSDWLTQAGHAINMSQTKSVVDARILSYTLKTANNLLPAMGPDGVVMCDVIHIDNYENVVINVTKEQFEKFAYGRSFRLEFLRVEEIAEISNDYKEVREGYKLCRFNSDGYLEICINRGKAASLFGLRVGSRNNDIKLVFE